MPRNWIDEGLRNERVHAEQQKLVQERKLRHAAVIQDKGPALIRELVTDIAAAVSEYHDKSGGGSSAVRFEALPHEGFFIERPVPLRVQLECRPDYAGEVIYCNMTSGEGRQPEAYERAFTLHFVVDESDNLGLRHENRALRTIDEVVEFLVRPVLFPERHAHS
jgi:hypothetical protein